MPPQSSTKEAFSNRQGNQEYRISDGASLVHACHGFRVNSKAELLVNSLIPQGWTLKRESCVF